MKSEAKKFNPDECPTCKECLCYGCFFNGQEECPEEGGPQDCRRCWGENPVKKCYDNKIAREKYLASE